MTRFAIAIAILASAARAHAAPNPPPDPPEAPPAPEPEPPAPTPTVDPKLVEEVLEHLEELEQRVRKAERKAAKVDALEEEVGRLRWLTRFISVYVDVGAFVVGGDGAGIRSDYLHANYPEYRDAISGQWVFMGDPFTTMINSLGEPAETGASREVTTDSVNSGGNAALIVNTLGIAFGKDLTKGFSISALAQFLPRPGNDLLDVPFAYVTYRPSQELDLYIEVGKIDSVLGIEYRAQDAPKRLTVTPSLICRYTCGRPLGAAMRLVKDVHKSQFNVATAITNGDNFEERFEPKTRLHANRYPTLSGHLLWKTSLGDNLSVELGMSGSIGPQDVQPDASVRQWHYGFDVRVGELGGWTFTGEFVNGRQTGSTMDLPCDLAPCLTYKGAYLLAERRIARLTPYVRFDWRDATHRSGAQYVYEASSLRATIGAQFAVTKRILAKAEYIFNHELDVPRFPHDVATASLVVSTE